MQLRNTLSLLFCLLLTPLYALADDLNQSEREMGTLVRYEAPEKATASIILLHGVGNASTRFIPLVNRFHSQERFRHINFILPNAPHRSMRLFGGDVAPSWFNISAGGLENGYDETEYWEISDYISRLIKNETDHGIPADRIVAGGFSQGGMVSLGALASIDTKIAGWLYFPTEIPVNLTQFNSRLTYVNQHTPVFHGHGTADTVITLANGQRTANLFQGLGFNYTFKVYEGMGHQPDWPANVADVEQWVQGVIPK